MLFLQRLTHTQQHQLNPSKTLMVNMNVIKVIQDFGSVSGYGKSGIRLFFGNPAKSGYGQISSRIWQMPLQLEYVQLITDKTNVADQPSSVFTILISITLMRK